MRRSVPTTIPLADPTADALHRAGSSCKTFPAIVWNANGPEQWCVDCGARLGERSWHEGGAEFSPVWLGAMCVFVGLLALMLVALFGAINPSPHVGGNPQNGVSTYGPPVVHSTP